MICGKVTNPPASICPSCSEKLKSEARSRSKTFSKQAEDQLKRYGAKGRHKKSVRKKTPLEQKKEDKKRE